MVSSIDVETLRNSQSLPVDVFLIFSEQERGIGEKIHESLMREGLTVGEQPVGVIGTVGREAIAGSLEKAGTILYLVSASVRQSELCQQQLALAFANNKRIIPLMVEDLPGEGVLAPAILPAIDFSHYRNEAQYRGGIKQLVKEIRQEGIEVTGRKPAIAQQPEIPVTVQKRGNRELVIWRSLFAAAAIGLLAMVGVNGTLYQKYQSASRNEPIALQQTTKTIAELNQVKAQLATANTKAAEALKAEQQAKAEAQQANAKADASLKGEQQAKAEQQLLNDRLYEAKVKAADVLKGERQAKAEKTLLNDRLYEVNAKLAAALQGERQAKAEVEKAKTDLNRANARAKIAEEKAKLAEAKVQDAESRLQQSQDAPPAAFPLNDILAPARSR